MLELGIWGSHPDSNKMLLFNNQSQSAWIKWYHNVNSGASYESWLKVCSFFFSLQLDVKLILFSIELESLCIKLESGGIILILIRLFCSWLVLKLSSSAVFQSPTWINLSSTNGAFPFLILIPPSEINDYPKTCLPH